MLALSHLPAITKIWQQKYKRHRKQRKLDQLPLDVKIKATQITQEKKAAGINSQIDLPSFSQR
jgi:hypothetical protein